MNNLDRNVYGVNETNSLGVNGNDYHAQYSRDNVVDWATKGLKITRLRLLSDPGFPFWDVSYCHGEYNGEKVYVGLPFSQLPKRNMKAFIIDEAKREGLYIKATGIFDSISTLN